MFLRSGLVRFAALLARFVFGRAVFTAFLREVLPLAFEILLGVTLPLLRKALVLLPAVLTGSLGRLTSCSNFS